MEENMLKKMNLITKELNSYNLALEFNSNLDNKACGIYKQYINEINNNINRFENKMLENYLITEIEKLNSQFDLNPRNMFVSNSKPIHLVAVKNRTIFNIICCGKEIMSLNCNNGAIEQCNKFNENIDSIREQTDDIIKNVLQKAMSIYNDLNNYLNRKFKAHIIHERNKIILIFQMSGGLFQFNLKEDDFSDNIIEFKRMHRSWD